MALSSAVTCFELYKSSTFWKQTTQTTSTRPERWKKIYHDGMVNGFCQSTIVVAGFSMVFFTCEPLVSMVFQWFFRFQPLVSMVFPMFFSDPTIDIEWMVLWLTIVIDGLSMVLGKVKAVSQKRPKKTKKKHDLFNIYLGVNNL